MQSLNSLTISHLGLSGFISWWWKWDWKGKNSIFFYWARTLNAIFLSECSYAIQHNSKLHSELQCQVLLQSGRLPNKIQWKSQHSFVNGCTWYVEDSASMWLLVLSKVWHSGWKYCLHFNLPFLNAVVFLVMFVLMCSTTSLMERFARSSNEKAEHYFKCH